MTNMKALKETHMRGSLSVEADIKSTQDCDFGIQVSVDGRIWICIDGQAFIRFRPRRAEYIEHLLGI